MNKTTIVLLLLYLVLVPAQAMVFNNLVLFNVAVPLVFIYLIITLPVTFNTNVAMLVGFVTGLSVDVLSDTPGVNALAATTLAFVRRPVFHLYVPADNDLAEQRPSLANMGVAAFLKYSFTMVLTYCIMVFAIDAMGYFNLSLYLLRVITSTIYTFVLIYALACLNVPKREKRL